MLGISKLGPFSEFQEISKALRAPPQQAGDKGISVSPFPPEQEQLFLLPQHQKPPNYRILGFFFLHSNFYFPIKQ